MIGKPEWFERRKYSGWGLTPKTWQGWIYIAIIILPLLIFQSIPIWSVKTRVIATGIWMAFLLFDVFDIMIKLKKDERSRLHEAIAERNALWGAVILLSIAIVYQVTSSALNQTIQVDWWIVTTLFVALIIKSVSNIYLDKKN